MRRKQLTVRPLINLPILPRRNLCSQFRIDMWNEVYVYDPDSISSNAHMVYKQYLYLPLHIFHFLIAHLLWFFVVHGLIHTLISPANYLQLLYFFVTTA